MYRTYDCAKSEIYEWYVLLRNLLNKFVLVSGYYGYTSRFNLHFSCYSSDLEYFKSMFIGAAFTSNNCHVILAFVWETLVFYIRFCCIVKLHFKFQPSLIKSSVPACYHDIFWKDKKISCMPKCRTFQYICSCWPGQALGYVSGTFQNKHLACIQLQFVRCSWFHLLP